MIEYLMKIGLLPKRMDTRLKSTYGTAVLFSICGFGMFFLPILVIGSFMGQIQDEDLPAFINIFVCIFIMGGLVGFFGHKDKGGR